MKLSFVPKLHNCDNHLKHKEYRDGIGYTDESLDFCLVCGRIKNHYAYGTEYVNDYLPKRRTALSENVIDVKIK